MLFLTDCLMRDLKPDATSAWSGVRTVARHNYRPTTQQQQKTVPTTCTLTRRLSSVALGLGTEKRFILLGCQTRCYVFQFCYKLNGRHSTPVSPFHNGQDPLSIPCQFHSIFRSFHSISVDYLSIHSSFVHQDVPLLIHHLIPPVSLPCPEKWSCPLSSIIMQIASIMFSHRGASNHWG